MLFQIGSERVSLGRDSNVVREPVMRTHDGRRFWAEETAPTKALRWKYSWWVQRMGRGSV